MEKMLYWTVILENKNITRENNTHQRTVNLQIVPRHVHSWWHHLSEKEAAVASCSLATIYQCFNDLGFSYYIPQPVDVLGLGSL